MAKDKRMKNGLDSLFDDNFFMQEDDSAPQKETSPDEGLMTVRLSLVEPDRKQPRTEFDEEKLSELAQSISEMGMIQPILVRRAESGRFTIVAGERRWRAARIAGLTEIPVIVRELSDEQAAQIALIENIQREDLNPIEEAQAFSRLRDEFGMKQEQIAAVAGRSRAAIANSLRLLDLPEKVRRAIVDKSITAGHAKVLCGVESEERQLSLLDAVTQNGLSVRELEKLASFRAAEPSPRRGRKKTAFGTEDKLLSEYSLSLKNEYGVDAGFKKKSDGSTVMNISFRNDDELKEFFRRLTLK
ncbi:MAG: ParB/RepB/Spo0J family partition protein [Ruminococcus sp.]|nr:ParB/RepB/Spo0J family partition protein [Ruminococcus sp.]